MCYNKRTDHDNLEFSIWKKQKVVLVIFIIYLLVGLLSSIIGAIAGLGGGVIIKPVLDSIGTYDVSTIGILSGTTVFAMACVSVIKTARSGYVIRGKTIFVIAAGSIIGGILGQYIFNHLIENWDKPDFITVLQAGTLAIILIFVYILTRLKNIIRTYNFKNLLLIFMIGLALGTLSAFLGIGGGPLNMLVLSLLFSMNVRDAAINSIFIIFFSQLASLITVFFTTGFAEYDLSMLVYMIAGGIIGGLIGTSLSQRLRLASIDRLYAITILGLAILNIFNMIRYLI